MRTISLHIVILLLLLATSCTQEKNTNWDLSFERNSKNPFGCYIAYNSLNQIFPNAKIESTNRPMAKIVKSNKANDKYKSELTIVVVNNFEIDSLDLEEIIKYINNGNSMCILANQFSDTLLQYFSMRDSAFGNVPIFNKIDSFDTKQNIGIWFDDSSHEYVYNGRPFEHFFNDLADSNYNNSIIGYLKNDTFSNLLEHNNNGKLILGFVPLSMTNHFMLQDSNRHYYEYLFSRFSEYTQKVYWASGMVHERGQSTKDFSLFQFPPLFKAFLVLIFLLLLFTVFESKRRQRKLGVMPKKENSSLEFTETVGRLYYNKGNHKNLTEKMITHYLEHIRAQYGLRTNELDEEFANFLATKTNQEVNETKSFISYLKYIRNESELTEIDVKHLYNQIKKFS